MIGLVVVTHGRLAEEFIAAAEHVVGHLEAVRAIAIGPEDDMDMRRKEIIAAAKACEQGAGVVILTTNHDTAIDDAFRRRLSLRVDFPVPEPEERERLWRTLLPREAAVSSDIDFSTLADKFEMTGGYIKNAIVRAAVSTRLVAA